MSGFDADWNVPKEGESDCSCVRGSEGETEGKLDFTMFGAAE